MSSTDFIRHRERFRAWLSGREYYKAIEALEYASTFHTGLRKDGITHEFLHQVTIGLYVRTLPNLRSQQASLMTALLHDVSEDYNVPFSDLEARFGKEVADSVFLMTKKFRGEKKPTEVYYKAISESPIASIVKGGDRIHNHQTLNVFTCKKQMEYIQETETFVLPMLRAARNNFPDQELAYENIKHALKGQIELLKLSIEAKVKLEQLALQTG